MGRRYTEIQSHLTDAVHFTTQEGTPACPATTQSNTGNNLTTLQLTVLTPTAQTRFRYLHCHSLSKHRSRGALSENRSAFSLTLVKIRHLLILNLKPLASGILRRRSPCAEFRPNRLLARRVYHTQSLHHSNASSWSGLHSSGN